MHFITVKEAAELEEVSSQSIRLRIQDKKITAKQSKCTTGAPGGKQWLVDPHSLSPCAKQKWMRRIAENIEKQIDEKEKQAEIPNFISSKKRNGAFLDDRKTINPAAVQEVYGEEVLKQEMKLAKEKMQIVEDARQIISSRQNVTEKIKQFAKEKDLNPATIYRWVKDSQAGVFGLLRRKKTIIQGKSFTSINKEVEAVIRYNYLQIGSPKVAAVIRKTEKFCVDKNLPIPSKSSIHRYIDNLNKTEADYCCLMREGQEAWLSKYAPHGQRAEPERVMQIVMGDHHKFDLFVEYNGKPVRPWTTMWFDVKSRCPVGWTVSVQANGDTIALALAHMMTPKKWETVDIETGEIKEEVLELGGLCETLYIDNGEDYKSRLKKKEQKLSIDSSLDLCSHLGIKVVFATPYRPQAKAHVERFFGTVARIFSTQMPGWCGSNPSERPAGFDENKLCEKGKLLNLVEFAEHFNRWIFNDYLKRVHTTLKCTPIEAHFKDEKLKQGWPQASTLNMLRCIKEKAKVYKEGIRRFGRLYWNNKLDEYVGQEVVIRFDPTHLGEIHVSTIKDGYICSATNAEFMKWGVCKDDVKVIQLRRKNAKKALKERMQLDVEKYNSIAQVVQDRKDAGAKIVTGNIGNKANLMAAITPLDNMGKKVEKERSARKLKLAEPIVEKEKNLDVVDTYILKKYDNIS